MRIIVNELQALKQRTGIGHYTAELLRGLRRQAGSDQIDSFPHGWSRPLYRLCVRGGQPRAGAAPVRLVARSRAALMGRARQGFQAFLARRFRAFCAKHSFDLYHEPNVLPFEVDTPTVATIHDLSLLLHPDWHPSDRVAAFTEQLPAALDRCLHFITDCDAVRGEAIAQLGIAPERITRVHLGVRRGLGLLPRAAVAEGLAQLNLPSRYLLYVGTLEPRKNILLLLRAYCSLPADLRAAWPLLLVGGWGWNFGPIADYFHAVARHRGVRHLGYLPNHALPILYNGARALVYPTHYEGFGLPPLEMLACGGAVIASKAAAVREVVGRHAHFVDANDLDGWRQAMIQVVNDDGWWLGLRQGNVAAAAALTWERCAQETLELYRRLAVGRSESEQRSAA